MSARTRETVQQLTPTEAAAIAAAYALLLAMLVYRTIGFAALGAVMLETLKTTATIGLIMSGAFVFNYAIANENLPQLLRNTLVAWHFSPVALLLTVNIVLLLLAVVIIYLGLAVSRA